MPLQSKKCVKIAYENIFEAMAAVAVISTKYSSERVKRAYLCPFCSKYHLTHKGINLGKLKK